MGMRFALLVVLLSVGASAARADYPDRLITFIVPLQVGGGGDATSRLLIPFLERHLGGARIAVINKPGAGGLVAWNDLANARPDGYTIGLAILPGMVTGAIERQTRYTIDSFTMLGNVSTDPTSISVLKTSPYRTLTDLIDAAKQRPGQLTLGVPRLGSPHGIASRLFLEAAGIEVNLVPLGDGGPTRTALLGGHVPAAAISLGAVAQHRDRLTVLGQMAEERSPHGASVPTFIEQGVDLSFGVHRAVVGPAGMPAEVVAKLRAAVADAVRDPDFAAAARTQQLPVEYIDGSDLARLVRGQDRRFRLLWRTDPWIAQR